jgi:Golgi nucleoside diphosphatase
MDNFGDSFKDILDFGYGSGDFLRVMRKLGWNIFGYDVHSLNLGIKNLTQEEILNKDWNVVTFFDSLEHLENFDFIKKLSKKTDNFIISVPATPFDFPINKNPWKHYKPGEHLHYFSPESLQILFENFNLKKFVCLEDVIRGKLQNNSANINTYHFEAK